MKKYSAVIALIAALSIILTVFVLCDNKTPSGNEPSGQGGYDIEVTTTEKIDTVTTTNYSSEDKLIALTFDDGAYDLTTGKILDILEENNSVATFFVVGYNIDSGAASIKRAAEMGCEIGNHSDGHKNLTKCDKNTLRQQVDAPNKKIADLTGEEPKLFRVPGGNYKGVENEIGMPLIQWSIDTEDWKFKDASYPDRTPEEREADLKMISERVIGEAKSGDIILMHDIYNFTVDLTDLIVKGLVEQGFRLVTVSEMFEAFGVELEDGVVYRRAEKPVPPSTLANGVYTVKANYPTVNMRSEPSLEADILCEIPNGATVTVEKSDFKWAFVSYESQSGWVSSSFLIKQ